jgi:hypothetical protein
MADHEKVDHTQTVHVADVDEAQHGRPASITNNKDIVMDAEDRANFDHSLKIKDAIKYYRWGIIWCLALSMTVVMEGVF